VLSAPSASPNSKQEVKVSPASSASPIPKGVSPAPSSFSPAKHPNPKLVSPVLLRSKSPEVLPLPRRAARKHDSYESIPESDDEKEVLEISEDDD